MIIKRKQQHKRNCWFTYHNLFIACLTFIFQGSVTAWSQEHPIRTAPPATHKTSVETNDSIIINKLRPNPKDVFFINKQEQAVLIGDSIQLLDNDLNPIQGLKEGIFVKVIGVSSSLHRYSDAVCDGFNFVKISLGDTEGIIDGRKIYQLADTVVNLANQASKHGLILVKTKDYRQDIKEWDTELITCDFAIAPLVWIDPKTKQRGLFQLKKDPAFERITKQYEDRDFLQFDGDKVYDRIVETIVQPDGVLLKVKRSTNKEILRYEVLLSKTATGATAHYLK